MATQSEIDRLFSQLKTVPTAFFDLLALYADPSTTPEQRAYIREIIDPIRQKTGMPGHAPIWQSMSPEEHVRTYLAYISMIDGQQDIDWRDDRLAMAHLIEQADEHHVNLWRIAKDMKAISSPKTHELFDRLIQRGAELQMPSRQSGEKVKQKPPEKKKKNAPPPPARKSLPINPTLFALSLVMIMIIVMAIVLIAQGEDPQTIAFFTVIILVVMSVLYSVGFYDRFS